MQLAMVHLRWRPLDPATTETLKLEVDSVDFESNLPIFFQSHRYHIASTVLDTETEGFSLSSTSASSNLFRQNGWDPRPPGVIFKTCRDSEWTTQSHETTKRTIHFYPLIIHLSISILPPVHPEPSPSSIQDFPVILPTDTRWLSRNTRCHNDHQ